MLRGSILPQRLHGAARIGVRLSGQCKTIMLKRIAQHCDTTAGACGGAGGRGYGGGVGRATARLQKVADLKIMFSLSSWQGDQGRGEDDVDGAGVESVGRGERGGGKNRVLGNSSRGCHSYVTHTALDVA